MHLFFCCRIDDNANRFGRKRNVLFGESMFIASHKQHLHRGVGAKQVPRVSEISNPLAVPWHMCRFDHCMPRMIRWDVGWINGDGGG